MWATQYLQVLLLWTYFSSGGEKGLKYVPMSNHQSKQGKDDSHSADNELHGSRIYRKFTRETEGSFTPPVSQPRVWVQENYSSFMHFWVNKLFSYQKKKKKKVLICSLFIKNLLLSYAKICHILSQKLGSSLWSVPLNILPIVKLFEQQWNRELVANTAAFNYTLNENQR